MDTELLLRVLEKVLETDSGDGCTVLNCTLKNGYSGKRKKILFRTLKCNADKRECFPGWRWGRQVEVSLVPFL